MKKARVYRRPQVAVAALEKGLSAAIFHGDCFDLLRAMPDQSVDLIISSPPYCMGKEYESDNDLATFQTSHALLMPQLVRVLRDGGNLCWQVGWHVKNGIAAPLDYFVYAEMAKHETMLLRNRIIWTFGHGLHCTNRFSGRHETVLWFSKGKNYEFDLDAVRVRQKYPGKTYSHGPKRGLPSGNPLGKNPGDVWEIPNVKANHIEKSDHPCQFPVALVQRLIRALSKRNEIVLDPFCGVASAGVAALFENRRFLGAELSRGYVSIGVKRLNDMSVGKTKFRPVEREIYVPKPTEKVAIAPANYFISTERY
ncbi:MAG TPA: site-specific DNA-methyltransferase [Steroidobacteraceae bacterium]|nr:site-specific DNA-methyltransferase [Steroidobacteraceae bacterium]